MTMDPILLLFAGLIVLVVVALGCLFVGFVYGHAVGVQDARDALTGRGWRPPPMGGYQPGTLCPCGSGRQRPDREQPRPRAPVGGTGESRAR